jgi:hypothetical protein
MKNTSSDNGRMEPNLWVLIWVEVPAVRVCTVCNLAFKAPMTNLRRVADAQESLRKLK